MPLPMPQPEPGLQWEPGVGSLGWKCHPVPASTGYLEHGLRTAAQLVAHAYSRAQALAPDTLAGVSPARFPARADDQAHLRALASLYLLSQLEQASLLPTVELLAGLSISGGVPVDLGPASSQLMDFWRHRTERLSAEERRNLFDRLFDSDFENLMIDLCEALYKLDEGVLTPGTSNPLQQAKAQTSAEQLSEHLLNHAAGESAFVADDILKAAHVATEILKDRRLQHAFGADTIWKTVEAILRRYGGTVPDFASLVTRGKAGLTVLAWLADARGIANSANRALVGLDHPVIEAAVDWLESSLAIEQNNAAGAVPAALPAKEGA